MVSLLECWRSEEALESTETIEWKACAAILDFICPLFGRGFLPPKLLVIAVARTLLPLFAHCVNKGDFSFFLEDILV
jgi:hypothetical protein